MKTKTKPKTASHTIKNTDKSYSENFPRPILSEMVMMCPFTDGKVRQLFFHEDTVRKMVFDEIANYETIRIHNTPIEGAEIGLQKAKVYEVGVKTENNDQNSEKTR